MKILFLTTHLNAGGITSYLKLLSKGFVDRGHEVFIASSGGDAEHLFIDLGVKLFPINIKTKSELSPKLWGCYGKLKAFIKDEKIDLIHAQTRVTHVLATWLKKKTKVPFISTCHGFFRPRFHRKLFPCWGDRVIAISEAVVGHLNKDFGLSRKMISLVKSGIELQAFPLVEKETRRLNRRKNDVSDERPIVGMVARLSDVKGQDILIRALPEIIKKIPDIKCYLFGQGKLEPLLRELVLTCDVAHHVVFSNMVHQVYDCLSILDVCVMPSRQEGLGIAAMEAQSAGIPLVASRVGGLPSLIDDQETGLLVEPENPKVLALAIIKMLTDQKLAQKCRVNAREFVEQTCSSELMILKTLEVYQGILSI